MAGFSEHYITVAKLKELIAAPELRDDDILIPNYVRNLSIERNGELVGYIDLLENCQEIHLPETTEEA